MDPSVKILTIKAGRDTKLQKKSKRYRFGPKKGELMTPSDESIDEMLINTSEWSETSDEPLELKGQVCPIKAQARGPRGKSEGGYSSPQEDEDLALEPFRIAESCTELRLSNFLQNQDQFKNEF
jgi:hypothetical protein